MADAEDKTHAPSQKKLDDAAKRGEVATAPEMRHALLLAAMFAGLSWFGARLAEGLARLAAAVWEGAGDVRLGPDSAQGFASGVVGATGALLAPLLLLFVGAALATGVTQGRVTFSWSRLGIKWSKVNPVAGWKRLFGGQGVIEFLKTLAKCLAVLTLSWLLLAPVLPAADAMVGLAPLAIAALAAGLSLALLKGLLLLVGALAAADFVWQRFAFLKKMRMSHQELKDEHKDSEGDPKVKAKQRQVAAQRSRQRMMAAVPTASVVITNPTHFAVALRYEHGSMRAPVVVAKGADLIALRIRELAREAGVPLVENKPLARALFASAEVDRPIPVDQYTAVAEVISFVLRQSRKLQS